MPDSKHMTQLERHIIRQTLIVSQYSSVCGKCGENFIAKDAQCSNCGTQLIYWASTYTIIGEPLERFAEKRQHIFDPCIFIGVVMERFSVGSWRFTDVVPKHPLYPLYQPK